VGWRRGAPLVSEPFPPVYSPDEADDESDDALHGCIARVILPNANPT